MTDVRSNDIDRAALSAMTDLKNRLGWHPTFSGHTADGMLQAEIGIALRAAAADAYQRGASWGLQQHQPVTVNITCPHAEATS